MSGSSPFTEEFLQKYYKDWPNPCPYKSDLKWASERVLTYLIKLAPLYKGTNKKGLVVMDLDDTIFFTDDAEILGHQEGSLGIRYDSELKQDVSLFYLPINEEISLIATKAIELGYKVIALTARPPESRLATITNLRMFKIPISCLLMNTKEADPYFKINIRKKLSESPTQDIVITIGDMPNDLIFCGGSSAFVKLPSPDLPCSYAYFPKVIEKK